MQITDEMADIAARILNKRLAEGNLYGVSREMLEAALALLPHPPEGGKMEAGKPVVYVSSKQLPHNPQHTYIACRLQPEGNFDTPLFASPTHEDTARVADGVMWQPIETAPKDGTGVDLWGDGKRFTEFAFEKGRWVRREGYRPALRVLLVKPTHWMPLPAPPSLLIETGEETK